MTPIAWVLGRNGLLGRSLQTALAVAGIPEFIPQGAFSWDTPADLRGQMAYCVPAFASAASECVWQIYWAAGTGTMGSTEGQLADETTTLAVLIENLRRSSLTESQGTIVFASSAGAVYAGSRNEIITESTAERAESAYGSAKIFQERLLTEFVQEFPRIRLQLARITSLYGPNQSPHKPQGLISHIARSVLRRQPIHIFVPFDTLRDYLHADDAASAMVNAASSAEAESGIEMRILASEQPTTIAQIIGTFRAVTRTVPRVITGANELGGSYPRRMLFQSLKRPRVKNTKTLLVGIAEVLAEERKSLLLRR